MDLPAIKTEPKEFSNPYPVCRLCLSEGALDDVFNEEGLDQLILGLLSITVYLEDPISQSVCGVCRTRIIEFHQFRIRCQEVQSVLQSWLQSTVQHEAATKLEQSHVQSSETSNNDINQLQCEVCHKLFKTRKLLTSRKKIHQPRKHTCTNCGKLFARRQHLIRHMTTHANEPGTSDDTIFEIREVKTKSPGEIVAVVKSSEQKLDSLGSEISVKLESDAVHQEGVTQECYQGADEQDGESTQDTEGGETSETDYEATSSSHVTDGKGTNNEGNQLQCDICYRTFKLGKTMRAHKKNTHGIKELFCPICERPFALRNSLQRHILTHQSVEERKRLKPCVNETARARPFKCDKCEMAFIRKGRLWEHQKKVHGPRDHECHICGFRFTMRDELEKHVQRHNRDRDSQEDFHLLHQMQRKETFTTVDADVKNQPRGIKIEEDCEQNDTSNRTPKTSLTECEKCQKKFTSQKSLWLHYKFAHKPKKLKCSICSVVFVSNKRLEKHILTNHKKEDGTLQPLSCPVCNKIFLTKGQLKRHALNHGPRKHCCSICNKTYTTMQSLESHMRCHEDSRNESISQDTKKRSESKLLPLAESQPAEYDIGCQKTPKEVVSIFEAEEFKIEPE